MIVNMLLKKNNIASLVKNTCCFLIECQHLEGIAYLTAHFILKELKLEYEKGIKYICIYET